MPFPTAWMILSDHLVMMILIRYRKSDREGPTPYENSYVQNLKTGTSEHIYKPSFLNYKVGVNKHSPIHRICGVPTDSLLRIPSIALEVSVCGGGRIRGKIMRQKPWHTALLQVQSFWRIQLPKTRAGPEVMLPPCGPFLQQQHNCKHLQVSIFRWVDKHGKTSIVTHINAYTHSCMSKYSLE